ncbi:MAG: bifunctional tRNA (5-methylaminomethyl-2-thiouridine)(34)-methyltransferase MnmD/FAD-dependent 5-carboxymethylaminomethyl-2-thiouridine(34) oxidoreductase MnmC [Pseudohongiellaceae bacterium]
MQNKIENAKISWLKSGDPFSEQYGDIYFSADGGLEESRHVFLRGNELPARFQQVADQTFTVGELGFGSGLNFLLCWQLWNQLATSAASLHYLAFEKHPLDHASLTRVLDQWPELLPYRSALLAGYPDHTPGLHRLQLDPHITLDLYYGSAEDLLAEHQSNILAPVDCWFLDGFSPARNPDMWSVRLLRQLAIVSARGTTLSSYSVAGEFRRNLELCGFQVRKQPGFGSKREMLSARFNPTPDSAPVAVQDNQAELPEVHPWFKLSPSSIDKKQAAVIGAGLAGCAVACSLARRGWRVLVFDSGNTIASGASGNHQAVLHLRVARNNFPASRFHLLAYLYASRQYDFFQSTRDIGWQRCGVLSLDPGQESGNDSTSESLSSFYETAVLQHINARQAALRSGISIPPSGGYWFSHGGWLQPPGLCTTYLDQPGIALSLGTAVDQLQRDSGCWIGMANDRTIFESDVVVLANGYDATRYGQTAEIPLMPVSGQITLLQKTRQSESLNCVIAGEKYLCPALGDMHTIGASYNPGANSTASDPQDDEENLSLLSAQLPGLGFSRMATAGSRAAVRCTVPDQLPVAGPVPDYRAMTKVFAELTRNAQAKIQASPVYHPGLYISTAHGSYGLATCPLIGEYLAGLINGEALPLSRPHTDSLHPARFLIRKLKKQEVGQEKNKEREATEKAKTRD